jgi:hypothetical protein
VYDANGDELGAVHSSVFGTDIFGIDSAQFAVYSLSPSVDAIETALASSDIDFSGADFDAADLARDLAGHDMFSSGDIAIGDIMAAVGLGDIGFSEFLASGINAADVAEVVNTEVLDDFDPSDLPAAGTVYSITSLGGSFANVYAAVPNEDGTAAAHITDTLVTPWGNFDIPTEYDAIAAMDPGAAFEGFAATSDSVSDHAFTLDGLTFDPGSDGFDSTAPVLGVAPLLEIGGGQLNPGATGYLHYENLEVFDDGHDLGSVTAGWNTQDLLGIDSTQLTVAFVAPKADVVETALADSSGISFGPDAEFDMADLTNALTDPSLGLDSIDFSGDITGADIIDALKGTDIGSALGIGFSGFNPDNVADGITFTPDAAATAVGGLDVSDLPATGTVYSVTDFGSGFANVYVAIPNDDGTAAASITDTLVTPWGNLDIPTDYDAVAQLDPGAAFAGLGDAGDLGSDNAFTIDGITFDPGSDGFDPLNPLSEIAPLLGIGGGGPVAGRYLAYQQELDVFGSNGSDPASIDTVQHSSNLLGFLDSTQFTINEYNVPAADYVSALGDSDLDFSGASFTAGDLAAALEHGNDISILYDLGTGHLSAAGVEQLIGSSGINLAAAGIDSDDVAAVVNGVVADYYSDGLPEVGSVYSVTDFGLGFTNVYVATPDADGDTAASIQDTLITPFGNMDLSTMFDAIALFDPADAAAGVDDTVVDGAFNLFDPSTWF